MTSVDPGPDSMTVSVIIPALNEEDSVATVVERIPRTVADEVIVVDNLSTDRTADVAASAGARVIREELRGYGAACLAGSTEAKGRILVFVDADGSFDTDEIPRLVDPLRLSDGDLVLGSRTLGTVSPGAMPAHQRFGNWLAVKLLRGLLGLDVTDLGPFRALRREDLLNLQMSEMTYGWTIEMMIKAARRGYRIIEVPVSYHARIAGKSKVSGTIKGTVGAGYRIIRTIVSHAWRRKGWPAVADESEPDE